MSLRLVCVRVGARSADGLPLLWLGMRCGVLTVALRRAHCCAAACSLLRWGVLTVALRRAHCCAAACSLLRCWVLTVALGRAHRGGACCAGAWVRRGRGAPDFSGQPAAVPRAPAPGVWAVGRGQRGGTGGGREGGREGGKGGREGGGGGGRAETDSQTDRQTDRQKELLFQAFALTTHRGPNPTTHSLCRGRSASAKGKGAGCFAAAALTLSRSRASARPLPRSSAPGAKRLLPYSPPLAAAAAHRRTAGRRTSRPREPTWP